MADTISVSAGRDYRTAKGYEFTIFDGDKLIERRGGFKSNKAARGAGIDRALKAYV